MAVAHLALVMVVLSEGAQRYAEKKARGECANCTEPAQPGRSMCEEHQARVRARNKATTMARRATGRCVICGDPVKGSRWRCELCQRIHNVRQQAARQQLYAGGICPHCGKRPRPPQFRHCTVCRRYMAAYVQRKRRVKRRKLEFHRLFYRSPDLVANRMHKLMQGSAE